MFGSAPRPLRGGRRQLYQVSKRPFLAARGLYLQGPVTFLVSSSWEIPAGPKNGIIDSDLSAFRVLDYIRLWQPPYDKIRPDDAVQMTVGIRNDGSLGEGWSVSMVGAQLTVEQRIPTLDFEKDQWGNRVDVPGEDVYDWDYLVTDNDAELREWASTKGIPKQTSGNSARIFEALLADLPRKHRRS